MSKKKSTRESSFMRAIDLPESECSTRATMRQLRAEGYGADSNMIMAAYELANIPNCKCGRQMDIKGGALKGVKDSPKRQAYLNSVRKNAPQRGSSLTAV